MMSPLRPKSMHHEKKWCLTKFQHWFNIFVHLGMKKHMLIPERNCTAVICVLSWATPGPLWPAQVVFPKGFVHAWSSLSCLRKPNPRTPIQISCGSLKPTTSQNFQNCQLSTGANRNYGTMNHGLWQQCNSRRPSRKTSGVASTMRVWLIIGYPKGTPQKLMTFYDFPSFSPFQKHCIQGSILSPNEGHLTLTLVTQP